MFARISYGAIVTGFIRNHQFSNRTCMETRRLAYHMMCDYLHLYVYIVLHVREIFPPSKLVQKEVLYLSWHTDTHSL